MGMGAFFLSIISNDLFSKKIHHMIQIILFTLAWKRGEGSSYLFSYLFSDLIVLWEQESGDRSVWTQTLYFCGGEIVGTGAFWRECGDRRNFFLRIYFQFFYSSYNSNDLIFHIGMEAWHYFTPTSYQ